MKVTGQTTVYGDDGAPAAGIEVLVKMLYPPPITGIYSFNTFSYTSDINGLISIPNMFVGAEYAIWGTRFERMRHVVDVSDITNPVDDMGYTLPPFMWYTVIDPCNND